MLFLLQLQLNAPSFLTLAERGGQKRIKLNWLLLERRKKGLLGQNAIFCWISAERARALERLQKKMVTIEKKD